MNDNQTRRTTLCARLKEAREYRGFSQEEVAKHLSIPRTAISLMENGTRRVEALELRRLAELYRTSMDDLTGNNLSADEPESLRLVSRAAAELSANDREEVLRFVRFLQARRPNDNE